MRKQARLRRLPPKVERRLINENIQPSESFMNMLRSNPSFARRLGRGIEHMRQKFDAAYPGETRRARIPLAVWEREGLTNVADFMRLTGLKKA